MFYTISSDNRLNDSVGICRRDIKFDAEDFITFHISSILGAVMQLSNKTSIFPLLQSVTLIPIYTIYHIIRLCLIRFYDGSGLLRLYREEQNSVVELGKCVQPYKCAVGCCCSTVRDELKVETVLTVRRLRNVLPLEKIDLLNCRFCCSLYNVISGIKTSKSQHQSATISLRYISAVGGYELQTYR